MGQPTSGHSGERDWIRCSRTIALLARLDAVIEQAVTAEDAQLQVMALHLIRRGGKRLRPALLMLCASFGTCDENRLLRAAAALELMHVASLYHDDIMDRAPLRRGAASTNVRWGNPQAAFAGTYLFSRACELWGELGQVVNDLASETAVKLCRGQLSELEHAFDTETDDETHMCILALKTASLFALPCQMGATMSQQSTLLVDALTRYGNALGLAFQLVDDLLDLTGDTVRIGKLAAKDLSEGIYSLPVLMALKSPVVGERLRELLTRVSLDDDEIHEAVELVRTSGTIEHVQRLACRHVEEAEAALLVLPNGLATDSLRALARLAIDRTA